MGAARPEQGRRGESRSEKIGRSDEGSGNRRQGRAGGQLEVVTSREAIRGSNQQGVIQRQ